MHMHFSPAKFEFVDFTFTPEPEHAYDPPEGVPMLHYTALEGHAGIRTRPSPDGGCFALRPRKLRPEFEYLWPAGVLAMYWPMGRAGGGFALLVRTEAQLEVIRERYPEHLWTL